MSESYVRNVIEAALLAAGTPLPVAELTRLFDDSARPSAQQVRAALAALAAEYSGRGIGSASSGGMRRLVSAYRSERMLNECWARSRRYSSNSPSTINATASTCSRP
jgi:segregation and condensation protein B